MIEPELIRDLGIREAMAGYSTSFSEGGALQFDPETIKDLTKIATGFLGEDPTTSVELEGGHKIESKSIDELLDDPYIRPLRIISIKIRGSKYQTGGPSHSINIDIESSFFSPISASISGERDECVATRAHLENSLRGCWLPYAKFYRPISPEYTALRIIFGWLFALATVVGLSLLISGIPKDRTDAILFFFSCFGLSFTCHYAIAFVRKRSFPKMLFNLGKSGEQVRAAAMWRQVVFLGFLLAIGASVVATLITNRLK